MSTLDEKAKANQYPYNSKFGMWAVEITEHISRNWFKKGYELCQKEYEEKLRWISIEEEEKPIEGKRVLSSPSANPKSHEVEMAIFIYGKFRSIHRDLKYNTDKEGEIVSSFHKRAELNDTTHWRYFL